MTSWFKGRESSPGQCHLDAVNRLLGLFCMVQQEGVHCEACCKNTIRVTKPQHVVWRTLEAHFGMFWTGWGLTQLCLTASHKSSLTWPKSPQSKRTLTVTHQQSFLRSYLCYLDPLETRHPKVSKWESHKWKELISVNEKMLQATGDNEQRFHSRHITWTDKTSFWKWFARRRKGIQVFKSYPCHSNWENSHR